MALPRADIDARLFDDEDDDDDDANEAPEPGVVVVVVVTSLAGVLRRMSVGLSFVDEDEA